MTTRRRCADQAANLGDGIVFGLAALHAALAADALAHVVDAHAGKGGNGRR